MNTCPRCYHAADCICATRLDTGDAYIRQLWYRGGFLRCHNCAHPIIYDRDSGYYIHAEFGEVDGHNGLYCSPEMWEKPETRVYAKPTA